MAFIGAGIQVVKGCIDMYLNKKRIRTLETIASQSVSDLINPEVRDRLPLLLKQTEHLKLLSERASRQRLSITEKEIAVLMQQDIDRKRAKLAAMQATQLDIAQILVSIQKLATETADELDKQGTHTQQAIDKQDGVIELAAQELRNKLGDLRIENAQLTKNVEDSLKKMKEEFNSFYKELESRLAMEVRPLRQSIVMNNDTMVKVTGEISERIEIYNNEMIRAVSASDSAFRSHKEKVERGLKTLSICFGIGFGLLVIGILFAILK